MNKSITYLVKKKFIFSPCVERDLQSGDVSSIKKNSELIVEITCKDSVVYSVPLHIHSCHTHTYN